MASPGETLSGKYKLLRLLGDGGMGSVYEAEHLLLGTHVAIKILHDELVRRTGLVERFLQEAKVSAQIKSPHVVSVLDVDRTPSGVAYIVMELLQGEPLSSSLEREGKLAERVSVDYTKQILEALEAAHALHVVHRDLKPENVFVTIQAGKPVLKLIDFGIAKLRQEGSAAKNLTVAGMVMGTAEYMAPEQAYAAEAVDARADVYAVGVMLYEMLSGTRPVSGEDARIIAMRVERGEVPRLSQVAPWVKPELEAIVHRALAYRPDARYANATEMRLVLEAYLTGKKLETAQFQKAASADGAGAGSNAPPGRAPTEAIQSVPPAAIGAGTAPHAHAAPQAHGRGATQIGAPAVAAYDPHPGGPMGGPLMGAPGGALRGMPLGAGFGSPGAAMPMAPRTPGRRKQNMPIWPFAVVALVLGGGAVGGIIWFQQNQDSTSPTASSNPVAATAVVVAPPSAASIPNPGVASDPGLVSLTPAGGKPAINSGVAAPAGPQPTAAGTQPTTANRDAGAATIDAGSTQPGNGWPSIPGLSTTVPWTPPTAFTLPTGMPPLPTSFPGFPQ